MASPTLATLRTMVRDRAHVSPNDPNFPDDVVNRAISMAVGDVAGARPDGWWFQRYELDIQNTAGDTDVVAVYVPDRARTVEKVGYVFVSLDGNFWNPVPQRTRLDSIEVAGGRTVAAGVPTSWGVVRLPTFASQRNQLGIVFDPPLPDQAWIRVGAVVGPAEFTADSTVMAWLPVQFTGAVVEKAVATMARQKRKQGVLTSRRKFITEAALAASVADGWVSALLVWFAKPYAGTGTPIQHRGA